ncbi:poly-gamma-glutamate hydrolase family protein [Priestia aryabhattai]|uniref:poly-gamma-glutamate hydrolase family protein n=1 Tax=Priestia aryabhattai TaxID=412384 RepID=UPI003CB7621D
MPDTFPSMTALEAATTRGIDWDIYTVDNDNDVLITSPHGGGIEVGTSELNTLIQEIGGYDSFIFEALRPSNNSALHVTSTNYDEPTLVGMVTDAKQNVALHGADGDTAVIYVGGLDICLRNTIWEELVKRGINAQIAPSNIIGEEVKNVSNRTNGAGCCQLEMTTQQRKDFFVNGDWSRSKRSDRKNWTPVIYTVAQAMVTGIEKARNTYKRDRYTSYLMDFYNNIDFGGHDKLTVMNAGTRRVHLRLSITNGVPSITYRKGSEYIASITNANEGILFTFKNVPSGTIPFLQIKYTSSEGFKIDSVRSIGYDYMRTYGSASLLLGLKETASASVSHTPMSAIVSGSAEIKIDL